MSRSIGRVRTRGLLGILVTWAAVAGGPCEYSWSPDPPIDPNTMNLSPKDATVLCGAGVAYTCNRASDEDTRSRSDPNYSPSPTRVADAMATTGFPSWTCTEGTFKNDVYMGTAVTWIAPDSPTTGATISVTDDDLPSSIASSDTGSRDDEASTAETHVSCVRPEVITVGFMQQNAPLYKTPTSHDGWDDGTEAITSPEYIADAGKNDPVCYSRNATVWLSSVSCRVPSPLTAGAAFFLKASGSREFTEGSQQINRGKARRGPRLSIKRRPRCRTKLTFTQGRSPVFGRTGCRTGPIPRSQSLPPRIRCT